MIYLSDLGEHKRKYPDFKFCRMVKWLDETGRWDEFKTVAAASRVRKADEQRRQT